MIDCSNDGWNGRTKRFALFQPVDMENLKPCMRPLIGRRFYFTYAGHGDGDEAYPGQSRWLFDRRHDAEIAQLSPDALGLWVPSEDLRDAL